MILKLKQDETKGEVEVGITYPNMDEDVKHLIAVVRSCESKIKCREKGEEKFIPVSDIYYVESVDKRCFLYGKERVYATDLRLYQLKEQLETFGFVQIRKSCLLNIRILESIRSLPSSRMEVTLINGEHLLVNRKYLSDIRHALEEES